MRSLTLVSHHLCPYVQRVAIALDERSISFRRIYIDLKNKPEWFQVISPLGKVPVLQIEEEGESDTLFESAVILEYLEDVQTAKLHPADPLVRAKHRDWMEYGSSILSTISQFYSASEMSSYQKALDKLDHKFSYIESRMGAGPYFLEGEFSLVDVVFGPVFRYFDVFDQVLNIDVLGKYPKTSRWRSELMKRRSIVDAVSDDYNLRLYNFLLDRNSFLSGLIRDGKNLVVN